jgi:hypothetical protein
LFWQQHKLDESLAMHSISAAHKIQNYPKIPISHIALGLNGNQVHGLTSHIASLKKLLGLSLRVNYTDRATALVGEVSANF